MPLLRGQGRCGTAALQRDLQGTVWPHTMGRRWPRCCCALWPFPGFCVSLVADLWSGG